MTPQRDEAIKFLRFVKANYPYSKAVIGGPHAKHYLDDVVSEDWDFIVPYDGERAIVKILTGTAERVTKDLIGRNDMKALPRPDRTSKEAEAMLRKYHYTLAGRESTTMLTGRGCPEKCTFCEDAMTSIRWHGIETTRRELDDIVDLGYRGVYIFDDLFAIALPMVKPICEELNQRGLAYRCNAQARYFTKWGEDFAKLLGDTGCYEIAFGAESGDQRILDNIRKRTTVEMNYRTVEFAKKHGIVVKAFLMLGLPGEDLDSITRTEEFIATSGIDDFQLSIYYPYRGTQIRDAIDRNDNKTDLIFEGEGLGAYGQKGGATEAVVRTAALTRDELLYHRDRLVRKYRPESHSQKWQDDKFFDTHIVSGGLQ